MQGSLVCVPSASCVSRRELVVLVVAPLAALSAALLALLLGVVLLVALLRLLVAAGARWLAALGLSIALHALHVARSVAAARGCQAAHAPLAVHLAGRLLTAGHAAHGGTVTAETRSSTTIVRLPSGLCGALLLLLLSGRHLLVAACSPLLHAHLAGGEAAALLGVAVHGALLTVVPALAALSPSACLATAGAHHGLGVALDVGQAAAGGLLGRAGLLGWLCSPCLALLLLGLRLLLLAVRVRIGRARLLPNRAALHAHLARVRVTAHTLLLVSLRLLELLLHHVLWVGGGLLGLWVRLLVGLLHSGGMGQVLRALGA